MKKLFEMTDDEALRYVQDTTSMGCRSAFANLLQMTGDKLSAVRALKEENRFINQNPAIRFGPAFAQFARRWLSENGMHWNQETILLAAKAERASRGFHHK